MARILATRSAASSSPRRRRVRATVIGTVISAVFLMAAPASADGGEVQGSGEFLVPIITQPMTVEYQCSAITVTDNDAFPDPVRLSLTCSLEQGAGAIHSGSSTVIASPATVVVRATTADAAPLRVCWQAEAVFADGSEDRDADCTDWREFDSVD